MKLGRLIQALEKMPQDMPVRFEAANEIAGTVNFPGGFDSYRGYYERLALEPTAAAPPKVAHLLASAKRCVGKTFCGYKGGEYVMDTNTKVHVAAWGRTSDTEIIHVKEGDDGFVWVVVADVEDAW